MQRLAMTLIGLVLFAPALADDAEQARRERLEQMKVIIDDVQLETSAEPARKLTRSENPVLRYTNPVTSAFSDGALFLWLDDKRPIAAVSPSFRANDVVWWELSSLSDEPLRLTRDGVAVWQPKTCSKKAELLRDAPPPAGTPAGRLVQMRALTRMFLVREFRREQWQESRLLTQPLYRWNDDKSGILDGALFSFSETTDPELLLLIEARRDSTTKDSQWYFSLAKMTSSPMKVLLNEREIWSAEGYWKNPRAPTDPYVEALVRKM